MGSAWVSPVEALLHRPVAMEYPFTPQTKRMGHGYAQEKDFLLAVKGSPESVLPLCALDDETHREALKRQADMAERGLRVIAVAAGTVQRLRRIWRGRVWRCWALWVWRIRPGRRCRRHPHL